MTRSIGTFAALAVLGCGESDGGFVTQGYDGATLSDARHDAQADASPDAGLRDAADARAEPEADVRLPCPSVGPAQLQATFLEERLAAGMDHTCGIRDDGTVQCWGADHDGEATPPGGTFVRLSAGMNHTCGIRTDGEVECWGAGKTIDKHEDGWCGRPECGQSLPLPGRFIEISAGDQVTCGLRPDFTIECWGSSLYGETEAPCGQFVQMSSMGHDTCAVDPQGGLVCWPTPLPWINRTTLFPSCDGQDLELLVPKNEPVRQVSIGGGCACVLYESGEADCRVTHSGYLNKFARCIWMETLTWHGVTAVSCGGGPGPGGACVLLANGDADCSTDVQPGPFSEITKGWGYACGLRTDGTGACWGGGYYGGSVMPPGFPAAP